MYKLYLQDCFTAHNKFEDMLEGNSLTQLVNGHAILTNAVKSIFTNCPSIFRRVESIPGLSDHKNVNAEISINTKKAK